MSNKYEIKIDKRAVKFLQKQPKNQQNRIFEAISKLPVSGDIKPLQQRHGYYRLRVGDYRIIYTVDNDILVVFVIEIGNRGDIYK